MDPADPGQEHCRQAVMKLEQEAIEQLRGRIDRAWEVDEQDSILRRDFRFENYYQTMAFVNAVAWIAHREDHHPDLEVGYNHCRVRYQTHSVGGLSENDFICAARVDALVADHR